MTKRAAKSKPKTPAKAAGAARFTDPAVDAVFRAYPARLRAKLLALRALIFETAAKTPGVGALTETLKWGQPSYLTAETGSGSTIRIDQVEGPGGAAHGYALFFHCQSRLGDTFRTLYGDVLTFGGNRSILLDAERPMPKAPLRHCIALALTYHAKPARRHP